MMNKDEQSKWRVTQEPYGHMASLGILKRSLPRGPTRPSPTATGAPAV